MANRHLSYNEFKNIFGDLGITEWTKYNWLDNNFNLPSNLVRVEYVQTTSSSYIDTGIKGTPTLSMEYNARLVSFDSSVGNYLLGTYNAETAQYNLWRRAGNQLQFAWASTYVNTTFYEDTNKHIYYLQPGQLTIDGNLIATTTIVDSSSTLNILLGTADETGVIKPSSIQEIYSAKFYNNGELVASFIPVFNTITGKYGLYDLVGRQFHGNAGTGDLTGSLIAVKVSDLTWTLVNDWGGLPAVYTQDINIYYPGLDQNTAPIQYIPGSDLPVKSRNAAYYTVEECFCVSGDETSYRPTFKINVNNVSAFLAKYGNKYMFLKAVSQ